MKAHAITSRGQVTIPKALREKHGLQPGTPIAFEERDGELVLRAADRDPDQAWFWTPEWQAGEREADEDIRQGRVSRAYEDVEELIADMRQGRVHAADTAD